MIEELTNSPRSPGILISDTVCAAGEPWMGEIRRGSHLRIIDLLGNQAVDTLLYSSADRHERYSASATIVGQKSLYLTTGTVLLSSAGRPLATIVADTCGRHDTVGGACSAESNSVRYGLDARFMHSCRDNFLHAAQSCACGLALGLTKRDIVSNINFFMNVPIDEQGGLQFVDGVSAPGKYVELRAEMDVTVLISNCPQLNNPCNAYNPTPIQLLVFDAITT